MSAFLVWLQANWMLVVAVVAYVLANVLPRPTGQEQSGARAILWRLLDFICVLTANRLPGSLKAPLTFTRLSQQAPVTQSSDQGSTKP